MVQSTREADRSEPPPHDVHATAQRYFDVGRAAWGRLALDRDAFVAYFKHHANGDSFPRERYAPDMYLACACACGIHDAVVAFEQATAGDVARAIASVSRASSFVEEVGQIVRVRLLVAKDGSPGKVTEYGGRASLRTWVTAVAVRAAVSQRRHRDERHGGRGPVDDHSRLAQGPEYEYLRGRYKAVFEDAVRRAITKLSARDRMILRLNAAEGMSIDRLGAVYRVGRSTAARWLVEARNNLREYVVRGLRADLGLSSAELESLAAEIRSQLEVSILRLLRR